MKSKLLSPNLWTLIGLCILRPETVGFNMADIEILANLPEILKSLLQVMQRFLDANKVSAFHKTLSDLTKQR